MIAWLCGLVGEGPFPSRRVVAYQAMLVLCIVLSTAIAIIDTVPDAWVGFEGAVTAASGLFLAVLSADYAIRLLSAHSQRAEGESGLAAMVRYALSPYGIFDFLAVVPFLVGEATTVLPHDGETVFGIVRFLKLARYSPALETLGVVVLHEMRPLLASLFIMLILAISASTMLYFAERAANPAMGSVPAAMWWAIVTLTTVGFGDVVPITALGKLLGSVVAVLGLCMFALPASILASGFAEEMKRQNFVSTWHLVAKVPFFQRLQASQIAEIAGLLKLARAIKGEVLMREGDTGECMYFIVNGQVEVKGKAGTFILKNGDFFGEIALIERCPRTATVKAVSRCQLLILDARDFHKFVAHDHALLEVIWETARARMAQAKQVEKKDDQKSEEKEDA
ncbi:Putative Kef-type K+ transport systems, predicted NAD-binding component（Voltage-dependent potassium channel,11-245&|uniref:cyclic nucleotide-gated ion channel n=1 Tax=Magnetospirillum sp. XM-1 TaxID=1663591 RepID=UPI00073E02EC|nr:cyclic nucleotide-gated ion channel [Magnetospirillum sp. XM-1]CUW38594.1 Putative Kef-type K+ transport systems, predicted NAD-binding component\